MIDLIALRVFLHALGLSKAKHTKFPDSESNAQVMNSETQAMIARNLAPESWPELESTKS